MIKRNIKIDNIYSNMKDIALYEGLSIDSIGFNDFRIYVQNLLPLLD